MPGGGWGAAREGAERTRVQPRPVRRQLMGAGRAGPLAASRGGDGACSLLPPPRRGGLVRSPRWLRPPPPRGVVAVAGGRRRRAERSPLGTRPRGGGSDGGGRCYHSGGLMFSPSQEELCALNKEPVKYGELVVLG